MLQLLGRATSGNVQKVLFLLEELSVPYERQDYGRLFENTGTPEYLAMNPTKKVPTLVDGELSIWESNTILRYLATKTSSPLYPTDPAARTQVERWMDWTLAALNPAYLGGFKDAKKAEAERAPDTVSNLTAELKLLEANLAAHPYVAGQEFSLADVALGPIVRRCVAFPFGMPAFPAIAAWLAKLNARPAFQKAVAAG
ncbi:glutathione S-transferase family protein [Pigmentiphaga aceris]|uniref:Glutathione S-transferase family protein n=1 Tax=Pigmentiphaga aceris TaxID=1940612 RepID=A0A5C0B0C7_9BURK|nr:glutathione S-transferase family protein [Pigmentiphaga aceris]QEI06291.1 glutathione S-transferase family protein [Pigmentiphaga aceris]